MTKRKSYPQIHYTLSSEESKALSVAAKDSGKSRSRVAKDALINSLLHHEPVDVQNYVRTMHGLQAFNKLRSLASHPTALSDEDCRSAILCINTITDSNIPLSKTNAYLAIPAREILNGALISWMLHQKQILNKHQVDNKILPFHPEAPTHGNQRAIVLCSLLHAYNYVKDYKMHILPVISEHDLPLLGMAYDSWCTIKRVTKQHRGRLILHYICFYLDPDFLTKSLKAKTVYDVLNSDIKRIKAQNKEHKSK